MSKIATDRVRELLKSSEDYFIQDVLKEAKETITQVVKERIRVFGSANSCSLPGNICPSGCGSAEGTPRKNCSGGSHEQQIQRPAAPINDAEIVDIVTRTVTEIIRNSNRR